MKLSISRLITKRSGMGCNENKSIYPFYLFYPVNELTKNKGLSGELEKNIEGDTKPKNKPISKIHKP